jgi:hypothetical protein
MLHFELDVLVKVQKGRKRPKHSFSSIKIYTRMCSLFSIIVSSSKLSPCDLYVNVYSVGGERGVFGCFGN